MAGRNYQNVKTRIIAKLTSQRPDYSNKLNFITLGLKVLFIMIGASFVMAGTYKDQETISESEKDIPQFASYTELPVKVAPQIAPYTVAKDLGNVENQSRFKFSKAAQALLAKNGFVVIPAEHLEFYRLYEINRAEQLPNFITIDSMLHNYHLMFDYLLKNLESRNFIPALQSLNKEMMKTALEQFKRLRGTEWEAAAQRNVGFFAVGRKLLDPTATIPASVRKVVDQELALIEAHQGISPSPVMNIGSREVNLEDYSQYVPRGHYDKSALLQAYFKTMMWYGRVTFRLKNPDQVRSVVLITLALNKGNNIQSWAKIYEPTTFLVGKSDDITYYQVKSLLNKVYGPKPSLNDIVSDKSKFATLLAAAKKLKPPQINSIPRFAPAIQPDRETEITGFRFMGQRFTIDAAIFQRLICREVGNKHGTMDCGPDIPDSRMLPKGLDLPAAMGSNEALSILRSRGETEFKNYPENLARLRKYLGGLKPAIWTQNLYWGWLYTLLPLTREKPEGYPSFMRNAAWTRKDLNTYLGSWTELKHDTILYAKQVYAEIGYAGEKEKIDDRGYVEPNPPVYARLAALVKLTRQGLQHRGLLSTRHKDNLERMEQLSLALEAISEKELRQASLTKEDYDLIRSYGGQLEHLWAETLRGEPRAQLVDNPAAVVADVATDPSGRVLEEATGYINEIYAVVPVAGKLRIAKGGVYSYYEFSVPLSERLTDAKWRKLLGSDQAPPLPEWTATFMVR